MHSSSTKPSPTIISMFNIGTMKKKKTFFPQEIKIWCLAYRRLLITGYSLLEELYQGQANGIYLGDNSGVSKTV